MEKLLINLLFYFSFQALLTQSNISNVFEFSYILMFRLTDSFLFDENNFKNPNR